VINEAAAARFFPDGNVVGRRIRVGGEDSGLPWMEVIGVAGSTRNRGLDAEPAPEVFGSTRQLVGAWNQLFLVIRTTGDPRAMLPAVRAEVKALDPDQPVYLIRTLDEAFAGTQQAAIRRASMSVLATFAVFALLLAAVGIYAVSSYAVSQRTREIGLRIALGAERQQVRGLMVRQALLPVAVGALVGLGGALALGRLMSSLLFEVSGTDPLTIAAVAGLLMVIALAASWVPARRASNLSPTAALQHDRASG
jgi:predicted lysophospholipase L1 biosynthesis ABC-type transport system permease subunit